MSDGIVFVLVLLFALNAFLTMVAVCYLESIAKTLKKIMKRDKLP